VLLYFHSNPFIFHCHNVGPIFVKFVDFLAFTSTVFAEILEDIRIECKDADGKKVCKPIKVGAAVDEGFKLMQQLQIQVPLKVQR
jgi:hypothetical protein